MANYNSILSEVYNFYQDSFTPRNSRFDAHKRSDLKNIYNSIVRESNKEPVYLIDYSADIQRYTILMKEGAMRFQRDIAALGGLDGKELFTQKSVYSSDTSIASAEYLSDEAASSLSNEDSNASYQLKVHQLANTQQNLGHYLSPEDINLSPGVYSFDVATPISNYELQFAITEKDNNESIQIRLAKLINNASIGLNATVTYDISGYSALLISSTSTGEEADNTPPFSISDENTSQKRGIIDYLGIRNITTAARWANYEINGQPYSSPDNRITIDNKYSVKLQMASDKEVTIGVKADLESLKDSINGIARSYNNFISTAAQFLDKQPRTSLLLDSMKRMSSLYYPALNTLGMSISEDGTINVDNKVLSATLSSSASDEVVDDLKSFTKATLRKISKVALNPMDYVDKRIVAYKDPNKTYYSNPYVTSTYSGMLFNGYM